MRLPNGFGTIFKLSGNRRRPWIVKYTIDGKQKPIGYFATYPEALTFLVNYNKQPSFFGTTITFAEVYQLFRNEHFPKITDATRSSYSNAFKHCYHLYDKQFNTLKLSDLQEIIHEVAVSGAGYASQKKVRNLFHMLFKYGLKNDLVNKDYSQFVTVAKDDKRKEKRPFTIRQIHKLSRSGIPNAELLLMLIYIGLRPSEFLRLESSHINWKQNYLVVKESKTIAGRNRVVPIHKSVLPFFQKRKDNKFIIGTDKRMAYGTFRTMFKKVTKELNIDRKPYECRHSLASMLDTYGGNPISIKKILGHAMPDVRSKYYTHKRLPELRKCINLLPDCY